jgi:peptidoglycan/xylan/chitin deacetylase (PgdA/CDA1 family)
MKFEYVSYINLPIKLLLITTFFLAGLFNYSCNLSKNRESVVFNQNKDENNKDSLPLIPKQFLELENNSNGFCLVRGKPNQKVIALTFDDGPTDLTLQILALLDKYDAKATFFWQGKNLSKHVDIIDKAKKSKHLIANHSWDHPNGFTLESVFLWQNQIDKTFKELSHYGVQSNYYRPPFGAITQNQIDFLKSKGIKTVLWSVTTMDWDPSQNSDQDIFEKFKRYLHKGAIVLMHDYDFGEPNDKLKAIEKILIYGKSKNYVFTTLTDLQ